jgi:hypothetical protein
MTGVKRAPRRIRAEVARSESTPYFIRKTGPLDRHEAEALQIEIKALARQHGLMIDGITMRRPARDGGSA